MPTLQSPAKRQALKSALAEIRLEKRFAHHPTFERKERARAARPAKIVAYDFETTRIEKGTPRPLYLTAYAPGVIHLASPVDTMQHLHDLIVSEFLRDDLTGTKFVAWNGNRFDAFFIAAALVRDTTYRLRPYLTRSKALRGLRITLAEDGDTKNARSWEFLDGIAMLGLIGTKLEKFLANFAPDHQKLTGTIDFEREEFDPENPAHCAYAMRDSVGLWHGMNRAQQIMLDTFNQPLGVTMGGACIKIFAAHIPRGVKIDPLIPDALDVTNSYAVRGGYCHCVRPYDGPVYKYDLNQAYAAAMRDGPLPCGAVLKGRGAPPTTRDCYIVRVTATNKQNRIPFYARSADEKGRVRSLFALHEIPDTWITSTEHRQLIAEGWRITCTQHYSWARSFDMREFVDRLETLRVNAEGGPSGPIGTMIKATGNHSYGKTLERADPIEYVIAAERPDGFRDYYGDGFSPIEHVYFRFDLDRKPKAHQQPQLGAFITAAVRMTVRRAALLDPDAFLYADTDCVIFSRDVTDRLDIDAKRYGAWKIEEIGTHYRIIAKKVYAAHDLSHTSAKGLNVRRLSASDFVEWYQGNEPVQEQTQLRNFLEVMHGFDMYRTQTRKGTKVSAPKSAPISA